MKYIVVGVIVVIGLVYLSREYIFELIASKNIEEATEEVVVGDISNDDTDDSGEPATPVTEVIPPTPAPDMEVVARNLTIPWDIVFLPSGNMLVSERAGTIVEISEENGLVHEIVVPSISHKGEGGLLGMVAHPMFSTNKYLYLYRTSTLGDTTNASINEVVRYVYRNGTLSDETIIVGNIPGSLFHNGGRIAFGPDNLLYIATGDARDPDISQDLDSLAGKILRVTDMGDIPDSNPFGTEVYAYGSRNAQGLAWDASGNLWSTEHGRTTATKTGMDEVNLIRAGGNYGWPDSEGDTVRNGTIAPKLHSGPSVTWAPGSAAYWDGSIFFGGLRGKTLYEAVLEGEEVVELREHYINEFGRIRTVLVGPDGLLYITTSNRDGRGTVANGDDRIIRLNPEQFRNEL